MRDRRRGRDRRLEKFAFTLDDRRTGFDRRSGETRLRALRDHSSWVLGLLIAMNVMNILDLALTRGALKAGAREANPIMAVLLARDPVFGAYFKAAIVAMASLALWDLRRYKPALAATVLGAGILTGVVIYHALLRVGIVAIIAPAA